MPEVSSVDNAEQDAYWEGYRDGSAFHLDGGSRPPNPYSGVHEDALWTAWEDGFSDAGQDS